MGLGSCTGLCLPLGRGWEQQWEWEAGWFTLLTGWGLRKGAWHMLLVGVALLPHALG